MFLLRIALLVALLLKNEVYVESFSVRRETSALKVATNDKIRGDENTRNNVFPGSSSPLDRRSLLLVGGGSLIAASTSKIFPFLQQQQDPTISSSVATVTSSSSSSSSSITTVSSVQEAIQLIESSCDKRFLHAVVASDYKFLYQPTNHGDQLTQKMQLNQIVSKIKNIRNDNKNLC